MWSNKLGSFHVFIPNYFRGLATLKVSNFQSVAPQLLLPMKLGFNRDDLCFVLFFCSIFVFYYNQYSD